MKAALRWIAIWTMAFGGTAVLYWVCHRPLHDWLASRPDINDFNGPDEAALWVWAGIFGVAVLVSWGIEYGWREYRRMRREESQHQEALRSIRTYR